MEDLDAAARQNGFENHSELFDLVLRVNLFTAEDRAAYENWQLNDGTKDGILKLLDVREYSNDEE
jgi:hypothetical protein